MANPIDTIAARSAGALKSVTAALGGRTGVFRTLSTQHAEATALCKRLDRDPAKRASLWPTIRRELLSHEGAELEILYPVLRERPDLREFAIQHDAEADDLVAMIDRLQQIVDSDDDRWPILFRELRHAVAAHVDLEEGEIFPEAQRALRADEIDALDDRLLAAKQLIEERLD